MAQKPLLHCQHRFCAVFVFLPCYGMLRTIWERVRGVRQGASARYILCTAIFVPSTTYVFTRAQILPLLCALCAENYFREHFFRTEPVLFAFSVSCAAFVLPFYRFFMLFLHCLSPPNILFASVCPAAPVLHLLAARLSFCQFGQDAQFLFSGSSISPMASILHCLLRQYLHVFEVSPHFPLFLCRF